MHAGKAHVFIALKEGALAPQNEQNPLLAHALTPA